MLIQYFDGDGKKKKYLKHFYLVFEFLFLLLEGKSLYYWKNKKSSNFVLWWEIILIYTFHYSFSLQIQLLSSLIEIISTYFNTVQLNSMQFSSIHLSSLEF